MKPLVSAETLVRRLSRTGLNVVAVVSGGIDSSTMLHLLHADTSINKIASITFDYGQKHDKEIAAAVAISRSLGIPHIVVDISNIQVLLRSALTTEDIDVPEVTATAEHYDTLKSTVVPNRNAIFLSLAVGYAVSLGYDAVAYAAHWSDRGVYPDCRAEFVESFEDAMRKAIDMPDFRILSPFINNDKSTIVTIGLDYDVPFDLTWSCYKGGEKHCGVCSTCRERKRAFVEAGISDPTEYQE